MKTDEIKQLIEKFFEGETTLEEEKLLKVFINREDVPDEFSTLKAYFTALQEEKESESEKDFEIRFLEQVTADSTHKKTKKLWLYRLTATAAVILLLVWFGIKFFRPEPEPGTVNDPVLAFHETRKALNLISSEMTKGLKPAEESAQTINENLQKINLLKKWPAVWKKTEDVFQSANGVLSKTNS